MAKLLRLVIGAALTILPASQAQAYCEYQGVLYARTTVPQEFRDSQWVVRARVLSARNRYSDDEGPWTVYRLQILQTFKGSPPRQFAFFTYRNSGGFYMDLPWRGHDIGGEYLLFLNPIRTFQDMPSAARGATFVNYSCGQSKRWAEVTPAERRQLAALSERFRQRAAR